MDLRNTGNRGLSRFQGKVAIITASTRGIGYAIAERLASEGAAVVVSSRKAANVAAAVHALRKKYLDVEGVDCHVSNAQQRKKLFDTAIEKFGGLDILVSNAGVNPSPGPTIESGEDAWDKIFEVNVKSAWLLAKEAAPLMKKRKGGSILFMSSITAYDHKPILGVYSISKTTLLGLTKTLAADLARENIRVNCLAPGLIDAKFSDAYASSEEGRQAIEDLCPMRRKGRPEEVAGVAAFLLSEDASYVTAETIAISGGSKSHL